MVEKVINKINEIITWIHQPLNATLTHGGQLVNGDCQVVQNLGWILAVKVSSRNYFIPISKDDLVKKLKK